MTITQQPTPPDGGARNRRRTLLTSAAAIAIVALAVGVGAQAPNWTRGAEAATAAPAATTATAAEAGQQSTFANLIASVRPAVISVKVAIAAEPVSDSSRDQATPSPFSFQFGPNGRGGQTPSRPEGAMVGEGSGFFISADGTAVTANHVVDHARSIEVTTSDGQTYTAHVVGTDPGTDVAVIKVDGGGNFTFVKFADTPPRVGDWVVAIGNPYGLGDTATAGIVSALARNIGTTYDNYMQIDAPIN